MSKDEDKTISENKRNEKLENVNSKHQVQDPIQEAIGNFGRWQMYICFVLSLLKFAVAWHLLGIVFLAPHTNFWCKRPIGLENMTIDEWKNVSHIPGDRCTIYNRSYTPAPHSGISSIHENSTVGTAACREWEYDRTVFNETIITEWNLVCDRAYLADVAQSVFMFGVLLGNFLFGMIADRFGRKKPLIIAVVLQIIGGVSAAFTPWFEVLLALRFLDALATGGQMITSFVICMEISGGKWRTIISFLFHIPFSFGLCILAGVSYLLPHWRDYQLAISVPQVLLLSYWWLVPESPRWLLAMGRQQEAIEIMEEAAVRNNLNKGLVFEKVQTYVKNQTKCENDKKPNFLDLFRTPNMRIKTLCIFVNWTACGLCFFGLHQYIGNIGNIFINIVISGLIELPGTLFCILFMDKMGRRVTLMASQMLGAISCLLIILVLYGAADWTWLKVFLASLGILGMSVSFPTAYLYSGELFPTVVRNVGIGSSSMCARLGAMVAPFIVSFNTYSTYLPPFLFSLMPFTGSILCLLLPETTNCDLPDTIEEGEKFGRKRRKVFGVVNENYNLQ